MDSPINTAQRIESSRGHEQAEWTMVREECYSVRNIKNR
jgi:hypothetical protein